MADEREFEDPKIPQDDDVDNDSFDDDNDEEAALDPESAGDSEAADFFADDAGDDESGEDFDALIEAKSLLEDQLCKHSEEINAAGFAEQDAFDGAKNIVGVGIGEAEDANDATEPGAPVLNVFLAEPASGEEVRRMMVDSMGVQAASDDSFPVNPIITGPIDADSHRFRIRPAPGGVSCGHYKVTAGTLGCLARGRSGRRRRRVLLLSNNHVIANSNNARYGDAILQPGRVDGGRNPRDRIAILERFVPIHFGGRPNLVDAATGWCWSKLVRRELVYVRGGRRRFFRIASSIRAPRVGMRVGKSGRTTQLTAGRIRSTSSTIRVNYGGGRVAVFRDQIAIRGGSGRFSAGGDSGSVVWCWDRRRNPVGLLFAGGGGWTFANKMSHVVRALQIRLYT